MCDDMGLVKRVLAVEQAVDKKAPDIVEEYEDLCTRRNWHQAKTRCRTGSRTLQGSRLHNQPS